MLTDVGDQRAFLVFGHQVDDQLQSAGEYRELAKLTRRLAAPHVGVRAGKAGVRRGVFAPDVLYPEVFVPESASRYVPAAVILGLSRQESEFNPRAYSHAGARGMMQLMPATAKITARKEGIVYRRSALLDDPYYNMRIGSAHLSHLLDDLDGAYPMVFAGYNAGKRRVTQWIEAYGDPRSSTVDPSDWIEQIPFSETRNYVQRVLENIQVYRSQMEGTPLAQGLIAELEKGGAMGRVGALPPLKDKGFLPALESRIVAVAAPVLSAPPALPGSDVDRFAINAGPEDAAVAAPLGTPTAIAEIGKIDNRPTVVEAPAEGAATQRPVSDATAKQTAPVAIAPPSVTAIAAPETSKPQSAAIGDLGADETEAVDSGPVEPKTVNALGMTHGVTLDAKTDVTEYATENAEAVQVALPPSTPTPVVESSATPQCDSYVSYMAESDPETVSAADLNAGALAELRSGGASCENDPTAPAILPAGGGE